MSKKHNSDISNKTTKNKPTDEWIWVKGYKATDKDMRCRNFQFEMHKRFDIPNGEEIELYKHGFHLCSDLHDVYKHYGITNGNRFFKVKALVRKSDYENSNDKLVAKSIGFVWELRMKALIKAWIIFNILLN